MSASINLYQHSKGSRMEMSIVTNVSKDGIVSKWIEISVTNGNKSAYQRDTVSIWPSDVQSIGAMMMEINRCLDAEYDRQYEDSVPEADESNGETIEKDPIIPLQLDEDQLRAEAEALDRLTPSDIDYPF